MGLLEISDVITKMTEVATVFDVSQKTQEYDISTTNVDKTLPALTGASQVISATWTGGDGTAKIRFKFPDGTYSEYEGEGEGHIRFEAVTTASGNAWKVVDYEDSGSNSNGQWKKNGNNLVCYFTTGSLAIGTTWYTITFPKNFANISYRITTATDYNYSSVGDPIIFDSSTKTVSRDRKSTRLNSSHIPLSRMPSSA